MKACKVYKGLETCCKIHGLYSHYFYMMFSIILMGGAVLGIGVILFLRAGLWGAVFFLLCLFLSVLGGMYRVFYKRSNQPKIKQNGMEKTVPNRELYSALKNKHNG